jgi:CRISPR-associated protein Cas2
MLILVAYDVSTKTPEGEQRLRKVAQVCKDFGQRVQKSVFECSVNQAQYEELRRQLLKWINEEEDSLRFYRLVESKERYLKVYGVDRSVDFEAPLVL